MAASRYHALTTTQRSHQERDRLAVAGGLSLIRSRTPELIDLPVVEERAHAHELHSLNRVNRMLRVNHALSVRVHQISADREVSVLDLGTGGGGFLGALSNAPRRNGNGLLIGLDRSEFALIWARRWQGRRIHWLAADARRVPLPDDSVDVVTCSFVLHHFEPSEAVEVLCEARRVARRGIVIADLTRSRWALLLTWLAVRVISRSHMFHVDGVRSVRAACSAVELADLVRRAGLHGARIERSFPLRLIITWKKRHP